MQKELISIIVPVYNSEKYLTKCLESIINQTYQNIEIICINDGSNDNCLQILKDYKQKDSRIFIIDKCNEGVSAARNDGIKQAKGNYITFVDSDDWIEVNTIELLYNSLTENKVDVVRCNYFRNSKYEENDYIGELYEFKNRILDLTDMESYNAITNKLIDGTLPCFIVLFLIKRELIIEKQLYFNTNIYMLEDTLFVFNLINEIESIYFLDVPLYHYFENLNSCTRSTQYYIRNMYNFVTVNKYLREAIKKGKFNTEDKIKLINETIAKLILHHTYMIYKLTDKNDQEMKAVLNDLMNNKEMKEFLQEANDSLNSFYYRMVNILLLKNNYLLLIILYKLRILGSKIKRRCYIEK